MTGAAATEDYHRNVNEQYIFTDSKYQFGFISPYGVSGGGDIYIEWIWEDGVGGTEKEVEFFVYAATGNWAVESLGNPKASGTGFTAGEWELLVRNKYDATYTCSFWRRPRGTETWEFLATITPEVGVRERS